MIKPEIERKFLINRSAELDSHCIARIEIVQTYLVKPDPDIQRRVRSMTKDGVCRYYYTEKKFVSPIERQENEREISAEEYNELLCQADDSLVPIIKTRRILPYEGQNFEIDSYPFSDELATMELELENAEQNISFPPFVSIIKEVTGDKRYSNAVLAANGCFPEN